VEPDRRDAVVDFIQQWSVKAEISKRQLLVWLGLASSRFYDWSQRYGKLNEHNAWVPRDHWLEPWEKEAILAYHEQHPLEGYRRLTYMMIDADVIAASPSSVYRVLRSAGVLDRWNPKPSKKGTGFVQPLAAHAHGHIDLSYLNLGGTFYYLCSILDGYSRFIVHWEVRESMTEADIELIVQQALDRYPGVRPRIISDNGPQFIARDFKDFIRLSGLRHVRTSPYYPQSNGKLERYHRTIKSDCIRPGQLETPDQARQHIADYVAHYNQSRLHSAIGYITPADKLAGNAETILAQREAKLAEVREQRRQKRLKASQQPSSQSAAA
jgi:transposase InsO family protein